MNKELILMCAIVLPLTGCTPAEKSSSTSAGYESAQGLGEAIFSALQSKDPDNVLSLYPNFDDLLSLKKIMIESVDDPLKKIKIEKSFDEDISPEKWDKQKAGVFDKVYQFLVSIDEGQEEVFYEQIEKGKILGLAPLRASSEKLSERFGVDSKALGCTSYGVAVLFFEHDGLVFSVTLDALLEINHRWYLAGDYFDIGLVVSKEDNFLAERDSELHPETKATKKKLQSHFKKISSREYAAKVKRYRARLEREQGRPPVDVGRGNTTQSD